MIAALALHLMDKWSLDPTPAYVAAWTVVLCLGGMIFRIVYLIINGG